MKRELTVTAKQERKFVVIDNGHFSGKHPFVSRISDSKSRLVKYAAETGDKVMEVTQAEWDYISSMPEDIDVLFSEGDKNRFFY